MPRTMPRVVILTGAGISAESGIRTFRGDEGLWEDHRLEDVATPEAFLRNPSLVQRFYNERRRLLHAGHIAPNAAHTALARLEEALGDDLLLVTQNIDNLHERAGSQRLIHMHGELMKARCRLCHQVSDRRDDVSPESRCPHCDSEGCLRPHVVWFGEMPLEMETLYEALAGCDLFVSIGTSGNVYPAAGFVQEANRAGAHTLELNLEASQVRSAFREHRDGLASALVPAWVEEYLGRSLGRTLGPKGPT